MFADSTSKYGSKPHGAKSRLKAQNWNRGDPQGMERELALATTPTCRERNRLDAENLGLEGAAMKTAKSTDCFSVFTPTQERPNFRNHQRGRVAATSAALSG